MLLLSHNVALISWSDQDRREVHMTQYSWRGLCSWLRGLLPLPGIPGIHFDAAMSCELDYSGLLMTLIAKVIRSKHIAMLYHSTSLDSMNPWLFRAGSQITPHSWIWGVIYFGRFQPPHCLATQHHESLFLMWVTEGSGFWNVKTELRTC